MIERGLRTLIFGLGVLGLLTPAAARAQDVIQLKTIAIIGNRELPKTLIIVPWKTPEPEPVPVPIVDSVLDEPMQELDAAGLQRRVELFRAGFVVR